MSKSAVFSYIVPVDSAEIARHGVVMRQFGKRYPVESNYLNRSPFRLIFWSPNRKYKGKDTNMTRRVIVVMCIVRST